MRVAKKSIKINMIDIFSTFEIYRIIKLFLSKLPKIVLPLGEVTQEGNASFQLNTTE